MLMTEWNWDDALAVRYEEGQEDGVEKVAKNALVEGIPIEQIQKITGLDDKAIEKLRNNQQ